MSRTFVVAFFIALAATVSSQCANNSFGCKPPWQDMLQQSRTNALAQRLVSKMSSTKAQMMICGCCCADTPCISSEICSCAVEECYEHILGKSITSIFGSYYSSSKQCYIESTIICFKTLFYTILDSWNQC